MNLNNPVIAAEAARKSLVENDRVDAHHNEMNASRADLDAQELHELEHSMYYAVLEPTSTPADPSGSAALATPTSSRRRLIDRLLRRR